MEREGLFVWNFQSKECAPFSKPIYLGKEFAVHVSWPCTEDMMFLLILDSVSVHCRANLSMSVAVCLDTCADFFILGKKKIKIEAIPVRIWPRASLGMSDFF